MRNRFPQRHRCRILNKKKGFIRRSFRTFKYHKPTAIINRQPYYWLVPTCIYLGVTIGCKLALTRHIADITKKDITKKATRVSGMLYPVLNKFSPIPSKTNLTILKIYISPILRTLALLGGPFCWSLQLESHRSRRERRYPYENRHVLYRRKFGPTKIGKLWIYLKFHSVPNQNDVL